jgi:hypothetical protein
MSALGSFIAATHADHEEREALRVFAGRPLVEACAPDAVSVLDQTEAVQILCRRVLDLERRLAALTEASA